MGSLVKKKIKQNIYYYYVESKRIKGKPRYVNQVYLGSAEKIRDMIMSGKSFPEAISTKIYDFADVAMLLDIAEKVGVIEMIDECFSKKKQGLSLGKYMLIAAINRAIDPVSKSNLESWYEKTMLSQYFMIPLEALTAQNYWNNMSLISDKEIESFEEMFVKSVVQRYGIRTNHLIYDATNFFTYIDTKGESELAQRGHCKSKRTDLKIVGLSMMLSPECNFPLLYDTYPGNSNDASEFSKMIQKTKQRYQKIFNKEADITVVFDRGNNSAKNIELLEGDSPALHYVGGLKNSQCEELFEIELSEFEKLDETAFAETWAYRTQQVMFEREVTVVVTYNKNLFEGQMQSIMINIEKTVVKLKEIEQNLRQREEGTITKGKKPTIDSITKRVDKALCAEYMDTIFNYEITQKEKGFGLEFAIDEQKFERLKQSRLGKTVLFTNRFNWTNAEIVSAYRSAWHIEQSFRQLKDSNHLTVRPLFHWTDQKIKVHMFYCVLAYRLCCILKKELQMQGICLSIDKILDELSNIKEVVTTYDIEGNNVSHTLSEGSPIANTIVDLFKLKAEYMPVS